MLAHIKDNDLSAEDYIKSGTEKSHLAAPEACRKKKSMRNHYGL